MKLEHKKQIVNKLIEDLQNADSVVLFDYSGIQTPQLNSLRRSLEKNQAKLSIVKNTLIERALRLVKNDYQNKLVGPTALVIAQGDPLPPIKDFKEFSEENEQITIKFGFFEHNIVTASEVEELAAIPGQKILLTKLAVALNTPIQKAVAVQHGLLSKFVRTISAISNEKDEGR